MVNISELADVHGGDYCTTLLGLHVFTGEDVTSAFKGKGKIIPLRKLQSNPKYHEALRYYIYQFIDITITELYRQLKN